VPLESALYVASVRPSEFRSSDTGHFMILITSFEGVVSCAEGAIPTGMAFEAGFRRLMTRSLGRKVIRALWAPASRRAEQQVSYNGLSTLMLKLLSTFVFW
jgi:hypothetical protein